jgi:hypothetical protein
MATLLEQIEAERGSLVTIVGGRATDRANLSIDYGSVVDQLGEDACRFDTCCASDYDWIIAHASYS